MPVHLVVPYDSHLWEFHRAIARLVGTELEDLTDDRTAPVTRETDQGSANHALLYEAWHIGQLDQTWQWFVKRVVVPMFGPVAYQRQPTMRIQYPGSKAVGEFHSDTDYGHLGEVTNVWIPLTKVGPTNGLVFHDYPPPRSLRVGDLVIFDGSKVHGNVGSSERWTRVSFDARVMPLEACVDYGRKTLNTGSQIRLGDFYASSDDIVL